MRSVAVGRETHTKGSICGLGVVFLWTRRSVLVD